jgi:hypothetical protein
MVREAPAREVFPAISCKKGLVRWSFSALSSLMWQPTKSDKCVLQSLFKGPFSFANRSGHWSRLHHRGSSVHFVDTKTSCYCREIRIYQLWTGYWCFTRLGACSRVIDTPYYVVEELVYALKRVRCPYVISLKSAVSKIL